MKSGCYSSFTAAGPYGGFTHFPIILSAYCSKHLFILNCQVKCSKLYLDCQLTFVPNKRRTHKGVLKKKTLGKCRFTAIAQCRILSLFNFSIHHCSFHDSSLSFIGNGECFASSTVFIRQAYQQTF